MLLQVLLPVERLVTVVTLNVLGSCMDDHVGLNMSFLGKGLPTHAAPEVLLTFKMRKSNHQTTFVSEMIRLGCQNFLSA